MTYLGNSLAPVGPAGRLVGGCAANAIPLQVGTVGGSNMGSRPHSLAHPYRWDACEGQKLTPLQLTLTTDGAETDTLTGGLSGRLLHLTVCGRHSNMAVSHADAALGASAGWHYVTAPQ